MQDARPPQGAQAALRAIRLLKVFTIQRPEMSLAELSKRSGLNKTTTHRLLRALQSESMIERNPATSQYSLGAGLMALGVQALASSDLRRRVRPMLKTLVHESGETATLEVPVEGSMLILDEVTGRHVVGAAGNVGTTWPLHATSSGKVYMAFEEDGIDELGDDLNRLTARTLTSKESIRPQLSDIRRRGYAVTVDELEEGFTAISAVIRGALGNVQGTISICGPSTRFSPARRAELGVSLCHAAARISPDF